MRQEERDKERERPQALPSCPATPHPDVFHAEKERYKLLRGERWRRQRGWYARLSAPGYLDCTDWSGPYDLRREAHEALNDMFDGDPLEDE